MKWSDEDKEIARFLAGIVRLPHAQRMAAIVLMGGKDAMSKYLSHCGFKEAWFLEDFQGRRVTLWSKGSGDWLANISNGTSAVQGRLCDV